MKVLVTGGFGYLGGRLAQFLVRGAANEVLLGSRRPANAPAWLPSARPVQTQWESPAELERICADVDAVVHLAGMNARQCAEHPVAALEFNAAATTRLLYAAIRQKVRRFAYVSTAHVYGAPLAGVITEETCPASLHPYASSHRAAEDVVRFARQSGAIEAMVIRLSNAYGAPAHKDADCWTLLVNDLSRQAVASRRMVLRSSGLQRRDFVPVMDVCRAIEHLLRLDVRHTAADVLNLGGGWAPTVWEMACLVQERCKATLGFEPELARVEPPPGETAPGLDYRCDTLHRTGFEAACDKVQEIDRLLDFCSAAFVS